MWWAHARLLADCRFTPRLGSNKSAPALTVARDVLEEAPPQSVNPSVDDPTQVAALIMVAEWTPSTCNAMQTRVRVDDICRMDNVPSRNKDGSPILPIGGVLSLAIAALAFRPRCRSQAPLA
jgi:hypothetical protein